LRHRKYKPRHHQQHWCSKKPKDDAGAMKANHRDVLAASHRFLQLTLNRIFQNRRPTRSNTGPEIKMIKTKQNGLLYDV
jgi:hypothetical protein